MRSIQLTVDDSGNASASSLRLLAHDVIVLGLRAAGQKASVADGCSTALVAGKSADASLPLQLQSFACGSTMASPAVVSALPAATLTQLQMTLPDSVCAHAPLSNLTNLRSLELYSVSSSALAAGYLSSIHKLSKLTDLSLDSISSSSDLGLLPQQLSRLSLRIVAKEDVAINLQLSQLTALQHLRADLWCSVGDSCLPLQLQALDVEYGEPVVSVLGIECMHQLQHLRIGEAQEPNFELLSLNKLSQLETLALHYSSSSCAADAAPYWSQLQQLSVLYFEFFSAAEQMAVMMQAWSQLTQLTQLVVECTLLPENEEEAQAEEVARNSISAVCHSLKQLVNLKSLVLQLNEWVQVQQDDMLHLSSLTGLTYLYLGVDNLGSSTSVIAVLLELTRLQNLTLAGLEEINVLPVIGKLQQLTRLALPELTDEIQQQSLKYLTKLRKLQVLEGFDSCSKKVMQQFWADLHA